MATWKSRLVLETPGFLSSCFRIKHDRTRWLGPQPPPTWLSFPPPRWPSPQGAQALTHGHSPADSRSLHPFSDLRVLTPGAPAVLERAGWGGMAPGTRLGTLWAGNSLRPGGWSRGNRVLREWLRAQLRRERWLEGEGRPGARPLLPGSARVFSPRCPLSPFLPRLKEPLPLLTWSCFSRSNMLLRSSSSPVLYSTSVTTECLISSLL